MQPTLTQLIEEIKATKVFRRNKKDVELKILALLYFFGLSLRKTSQFLSLFDKISHESVRLYYQGSKKLLIDQQRKREG